MSRLLDKLKQAELARKARETGVGDAAAKEAVAQALREAARLTKDRVQAEAERLASERARVAARAEERARDRDAFPSPARRPWPVRTFASFAAVLALGIGLGWFLSSSLQPKGGAEVPGGAPLVLKLDRDLHSFASRLRTARPPAIEK